MCSALSRESVPRQLRRVLTTKFKVPADRVEAMEAIFAPFPILPKPSRPSDEPERDPSDRWVLATALDGGAEVLVTGDEDLLAVHGSVPLRILNPRAFWELLRQPPTT